MSIQVHNTLHAFVLYIQLSDYTVELENVIVDDASRSPVRDDKLPKKKIRHSFGCSRDMDWQRRMEGFTGLSIKTNVSKPIKAKTSKKCKRNVKGTDRLLS